MLYLAVVKSSIDMVLVREDDELKGNANYYLSCVLVGPELKYSHIENMELESFQAMRYATSSKLHFVVQDDCFL
jgi:hypothetical protein